MIFGHMAIYWGGYLDLNVIFALLLCCPKIDSNGVGDVGECWAIQCLFCWGIGFRVLIISGYGLLPSHSKD